MAEEGFDRMQPLQIVVMPLVLLLIGWWIQRSIAETGARKDYVQIASQILSAAPKDQPAGLREYAIELLNEYSTVKVSEDLKKALVARQVDLGMLADLQVARNEATRLQQEYGALYKRLTGSTAEWQERYGGLQAENARLKAELEKRR